MDKKGGRRYQHEIVDSTRDLINAVSTFKQAVFKGTMMGEAFDRYNMDKVMNQFNQYLRMWENYADEIADGLKDCRAEKTDIRTLDYDEVREFIYANYDYASVLQFADGIFKGVGNGKFQDSDDVNDFFDHTISKAFNDMPSNVGGILDTILQPEQSEGYVDNLSFNQFKTVRTSTKLFNSRSRTEVYNAIQKTLQYLVDNIEDLKTGTTYNGTRLLIASINKILEYAQITAVVYAARIYIIGAYCYPFILVKGNITKDAEVDDDKPATESVLEEAAPNYDETRYHIMRDLDDGIYRSPGETRKMIDTMSKWITDIGADNLFSNMNAKPGFNRSYVNEKELQGNKFCQPMFDNPIFARIAYGRGAGFPVYHGRSFMDGSMNELVEMLRDSMYDRPHSISTAASAKDGILHIIRGVTVEKETLDEYKKLAVDLYVCAVSLLCGVQSLCDTVAELTQSELKEPVSSLPNANTGSEGMRLLSYLYRDISFAIIQKARYIEDRLNRLSEDNLKKIYSDLSIKVPGSINDEVDMNHFMMVAVPDTTRLPLDLMDLYSLPTFEEMQMFDDWLKNDPYFEHDEYFSEAFNLSSLINAIIAALQACKNKIMRFWQDKTVQMAVKWVTDHEDELRKLDFNGKSMDVLPFRVVNGKEMIDITPMADSLGNGLKAFDVNKCKDPAYAQEFVKSLYPEAVYPIFHDQNDKDGKVGAAKFRNWLLFGENAANQDQEPNPTTITGNQINTHMAIWIGTVKNDGAKLIKNMTQYFNDFQQEINKMKTKIAGVTANNGTTPKTEAVEQPHNPSDTSNPADQQAKADQEQQKKQETDAQNQTINSILADSTKAVNQLWSKAIDYVVFYIRTEYGYLKEAYGIANR